MKYAYHDHNFLLGADTEILRNLANSLYPQYLQRLYQEGKTIQPAPLPVLDADFVESSEALWFRVLSEVMYAELSQNQEGILHTLLMFGSARIGNQDWHSEIPEVKDSLDAARQIAKEFTQWSLEQSPNSKQAFAVCTGGGGGIMEAGNQGAHEAGGVSLGMNIILPFEQEHNPYITEHFVFNFRYFFTRKFHFLRRGKAMIVFPGGFGSFDELFESLTLIQTKKIEPIPIILFHTKFWKDVVQLEKLLEYGTLSQEDLDLFRYEDSVENVLELIKAEFSQFIPSS